MVEKFNVLITMTALSSNDLYSLYICFMTGKMLCKGTYEL